MSASDEITNSEDYIDSRDVIARIEYLEDMDERDDSQNEELTALKALAADGEGYSDWEHGAQLVRDSYFKDHAQELAEDCGMIPDNNAWPCTCIDWEQAARELQMDYSAIEFGDVTYWVR